MKITDYEVIDLGFDSPDYFQGFGVACTQFSECAYGVGDNPREALDDCLDIVAQSFDNIDIADLEKRILARFPALRKHIEELPSACAEYGEESDMQYYIGIRFNIE